MMANLNYDIPFHPFGGWLRPYVGAGIGYARPDISGVSGGETATFHLPQNNTVTTPVLARFGSGNAFAYQAIVGATLPIQWMRGLEATFEYRYFGTLQTNIERSLVATGNNTVNGVIPSSSVRQGFSLHDNDTNSR
jgi:opacity protein-like surface antigen